MLGKICLYNSWQDVHFRSDESSWRTSSELLVEIASHGEDTGFEVPCLIVAAKDDLDSFPMAIQESTRVFLLNFHLHYCVHNWGCMVLYIIIGWLNETIKVNMTRFELWFYSNSEKQTYSKFEIVLCICILWSSHWIIEKHTVGFMSNICMINWWMSIVTSIWTLNRLSSKYRILLS